MPEAIERPKPGVSAPPKHRGRDVEEDLLKAQVELTSESLVHGIFQRPGRHVSVVRTVLNDASRFNLVVEISRALEIEIHAEAAVSVAFVSVPASSGPDSYDDLVANERVLRRVSNVTVYGKPAAAGAVLVVTIVEP